MVRKTEWGVKFKKVYEFKEDDRYPLLSCVLSLTMISQPFHPGNWTTNYEKYIDLSFLLQINIKLKSEMPVQIDGEPWMQAAGNVIVRPILTQVLLKGVCHI